MYTNMYKYSCLAILSGMSDLCGMSGTKFMCCSVLQCVAVCCRLLQRVLLYFAACDIFPACQIQSLRPFATQYTDMHIETYTDLHISIHIQICIYIQMQIYVDISAPSCIYLSFCLVHRFHSLARIHI